MIYPKVRLHVINEDVEDNKILECTLAAKTDVILPKISIFSNSASLGKLEYWCLENS